MVSQSAPAVMARNMPLPEVETTGFAPYVCATTYPNGATGIATEGRVSAESRWFEPRAKITIKIKDAGKPIGIVGRYKELILEFAGDLSGVENIWAQDLLADGSSDIKGKVKIQGNRLFISGELIDKVGTAAATDGDISVPGMVLRLSGQKLPLAGVGFTPKVRPEIALGRSAGNSKGYIGTAKIEKSEGRYRVSDIKGNKIAFALQKLLKSYSSGKLQINWTMASVDVNDVTRNGFLIVSSDEDALSSLLAGSWMGSKQITVFEGLDGHANSPKVSVDFNARKKCQLKIDLDKRSAELTINGVKSEILFSESMTGISYVGFAVKGAKTDFTEFRISR